MNFEQKQAVGQVRVIEALYEVDTANGGFATVVNSGTGTPLVLQNCKVESVLDGMASEEGRTLKALRHRRCLVTGNTHGHIDYYELSPSRIFMPVPYRRPVNSNHGIMAYVNISRVVAAKKRSGGLSLVRFLSGMTLPVRLTAKRLQDKIDLGRKLLYANVFAADEELRHLRVTLQRLQRQERVFG